MGAIRGTELVIAIRRGGIGGLLWGVGIWDVKGRVRHGYRAGGGYTERKR